jgi:hypothetical protein
VQCDPNHNIERDIAGRHGRPIRPGPPPEVQRPKHSRPDRQLFWWCRSGLAFGGQLGHGPHLSCRTSVRGEIRHNTGVSCTT